MTWKMLLQSVSTKPWIIQNLILKADFKRTKQLQCFCYEAILSATVSATCPAGRQPIEPYSRRAMHGSRTDSRGDAEPQRKAPQGAAPPCVVLRGTLMYANFTQDTYQLSLIDTRDKIKSSTISVIDYSGRASELGGIWFSWPTTVQFITRSERPPFSS